MYQTFIRVIHLCEVIAYAMSRRALSVTFFTVLTLITVPILFDH
jgi:hypothetical protein